jgi:hypothetical protein
VVVAVTLRFKVHEEHYTGISVSVLESSRATVLLNLSSKAWASLGTLWSPLMNSSRSDRGPPDRGSPRSLRVGDQRALHSNRKLDEFDLQQLAIHSESAERNEGDGTCALSASARVRGLTL